MTDVDTYFSSIQQFFIEKVGCAQLVGGRDLELIEKFRESGIPRRVVCRGIDRSVRAAREGDSPRSIYECRNRIEEEVEKWSERLGGESSDSETRSTPADTPDSSMTEILEGLARTFERPEFREVYSQFRARLEDDRPLSFEDISSLDRDLQRSFYRALSDEERRSVERELAELNERDESLSHMSESARRAHVCARRREILEQRFGYVSLADAIEA